MILSHVDVIIFLAFEPLSASFAIELESLLFRGSLNAVVVGRMRAVLGIKTPRRRWRRRRLVELTMRECASMQHPLAMTVHRMMLNILLVPQTSTLRVSLLISTGSSRTKMGLLVQMLYRS